jgi:pimeloyl-ACP methyl ester carboxylesterase
MPHVTFIHGIANKPAVERLHQIWLNALAFGDGIDFGANGVTSTMVYWADVMYDAPVPEGASEESTGSAFPRTLSQESSDASGTMPLTGDVDMSWLADASPEEQKLVNALAAEVAMKSGDPALAVRAELSAASNAIGAQLERIPLPWFVKQPLMRILLRDVHHYLFNASSTPRPGQSYAVRDEIRRRMLEKLHEGAAQSGPHVVVSHSMGTVVAYDCIKRLPDAPRVDGFMTIGSPLGLDEVQDNLHPEGGNPGWSRANGFPSERVGGTWVNVYDRFDPVVGFDPQFANDFLRGGERVVDDVNEQNHGAWRHNISHYLRGPKLREKLAKLLELE